MASNTLRLLYFPAIIALVSLSVSAKDNAELERFQGHWKVTELVEDGKVIPQAAIKEWLPSGGKVEIAENAIIFVSPGDGKKYVKVFSVNASEYPKQIDVSTREKKDGWGIYQFENGRLVICVTDPGEGDRPDDFSAKDGSKRMRMVLERDKANKAIAQPKPAAEAPAGATAKLLTDAEVTKLLVGNWQYKDSIGSLFVTFNNNGTFSTTRQVQELRLFKKVFVQTPVSTGTWKVENGKLQFQVQASTHIDRVHKAFDFQIRSISQNDMIFVDYLGLTGRAMKLP